MADEDTGNPGDEALADTPEDFTAIADQIAAGIAKHLTADTIRDLGVGFIVQSVVGIIKIIATTAVPFAEIAGQTLVALEEPVLPILAGFAAPIVGGLFGTDVSEESFHARSGREGRGEASNAVVEAFNTSLYGGNQGEIEPSDEGAKRIAGAAVHATIEGWLNGALPEVLGEFIPIDWLKFKEFTELSHEIIQTLGLSRLVRRGFSPLVDVTAATPMRWFVNRAFRPNLLPEGEIIRALLRGDYSDAEAAEELARLGYTDRRQEMLRKSAAKRLSLEEALTLKRVGIIDDAAVQKVLTDEGYDQETAAAAVNARQQARLEAIEQSPLSSVRRSFATGDLPRADMESFASAIIDDKFELANWLAAADVEQRLNIKHLSHAEVIECVELNILPTAYYREWLQREGYPDVEATALEIRLRTKIDERISVDQARREIAAQRLADQVRRDEAAAKRAAELEAEHALARRGSLAELRRAAARGIVPIARVVEVLSALYDGDTVNIYVQLIEADRADYLDEQARRADAVKRAATRSIDVGALERAVLEKVLAPADFRQRLAQLQFSPADADLLTATLVARLRDLDNAQRLRDQAAAAAKVRSIDLGRAEQLVRRGVATLAQYDGLLKQLGYEDASRAAMVELLQLHIADDAAAAAERAKAEARLNAKGVSLETFRRSVILGVKTEADFQRFLVEQKFTSDAQLLLLAELRDDVAQAADARRRRAEAAARDGSPALSLDRVSRAARLGIIRPDVYQERLVRDGYSGDDIAIEMALLVTEIADVQAARAKRAALEQQAERRGLTLADVERGVKVGAASIEDYRSRAAALGYAPEDIDVLVAVLVDELGSLTDARTRRDQVAGELGTKNLSLAQLEAAVRAGLRSIDDYIASVEQLGYGADDAQLLASLVLQRLGGDGGAP